MRSRPRARRPRRKLLAQAGQHGNKHAGGEIAVFVVCTADGIERGNAKAFSLSRINETGESRPFPIVIVRTHADDYFGYVNSCPHQGVWLNIGEGDFFTPRPGVSQMRPARRDLRDRHRAVHRRAVQGESLEPIALAVVDGDVCICGVALVEDDRYPDPFDDVDDTMEIMIHPD